MKKSEIAMIILIASVSVMIAFLIANSLPFLKLSDEGVDVPTATEFSVEVTDPDPEIFNDKAINPTIKTVIGR